jgi:predicted flap endonuclease-1-like 5' DNA nuclease
MTLSIIFLMTSECLKALLTALAMSVIPALLGWLAARTFFKIDALKASVAKLTDDNNGLSGKVGTLTTDNTDLRVKLTQIDAELHDKTAQLSKIKNDLVIAESERNVFKGKLEEATLALAASAEKPSPAAAKTGTVEFAGKKIKPDDLKIVEGIGPKIEELLHAAGIKTWKQLAEAAVERLKAILDEAGPRFQMHDPGTWPEQSALADAGDWEGLKTLQDELTAGKA